MINDSPNPFLGFAISFAVSAVDFPKLLNSYASPPEKR